MTNRSTILADTLTAPRTAGLTPEVRDGGRHLQVRFTNQFGKSCLVIILRSARQASWRAIKENRAVLAPVAAESGAMSDIIDLLGDAMGTSDSRPRLRASGRKARRRRQRPLRETHGKASDAPTAPNFWCETTIDNYLRARAARARCCPPSNATWR